MDKLQNTFIIAEAGVNFNGDLDRAKLMAKTAKECGADAVKYQTFWNIGCLKEYEMPKEKWIELKKYCDEVGIEFMTTAHWGSPIGEFYKDEDYEVMILIDKLVKRHKVASPYLINKKYIMVMCAIADKPLIISTGSIIHDDGVATMQEIERCLNWIEERNNRKKIILLYCVSKYPAQKYDWKKIEELKRFGYPVGISDHTTSISAKPYPVIEKHFKLDDNCIDSKVSLNPVDFKKYVESIYSFI